MKYLPDEYLWFVERLLREYPDKLREKGSLGQTIEALCRPPSVPEASGSGRVSEPERVMDAKLSNSRYQRLSRQIERIEAGLAELTTEESDFLELAFWSRLPQYKIAEYMGFPDRKNVWRLKMRILRKIAPFVLGEWIKE